VRVDFSGGPLLRLLVAERFFWGDVAGIGSCGTFRCLIVTPRASSVLGDAGFLDTFGDWFGLPSRLLERDSRVVSQEKLTSVNCASFFCDVRGRFASFLGGLVRRGEEVVRVDRGSRKLFPLSQAGRKILPFSQPRNLFFFRKSESGDEKSFLAAPPSL